MEMYQRFPKSLKDVVIVDIDGYTFNFNFFTIDNDSSGKKEDEIDYLTFAFTKGEHGHANAFDGPSIPRVPNILAHSALPPHKHICYDLENTWSVELLLSVTLHELGHCLGLLDVSSNDRRVPSIMGPDDINYTEYQLFDKRNIIKLYPFIGIKV
ncbi:unnamed protein product [Euphydryas editha]|uniref:Peptidase M10 metallopeptidase domain-containing protein n=1 Tax=Euphydryas editha TaxID=104508 RepID=A0AAU9UMY9_EUPED|nr:unnamed protein product [Euphydryas editha]